jgi:hypothetical protein
MEKGIFFIANINEGSIEPWHYFFYFSQINISHGEVLAVLFFPVKLNKTFVVHNGYDGLIGG